MFRVFSHIVQFLTSSNGRVAVLTPFLISVLLSCGGKKAHNLRLFRYNEATGIASLDPAFAKNQSVIWAVHQIYNTLVETDSQMNIVPSLAKSWTISPDGLTYTFTIRDDVRFHDHPLFPEGKGRLMKASDIVYSLSRIIDPATASSGAWIFNEKLDLQNPFEAPNDSTVVIRLIQPFRPMLGILSMQYCSVVPKEIVEHYGKDFRRNPVGTGPFRFSLWEEGQAMVLLKNEHYFEKDSSGKQLPYIDGVQISFLDNKAAEFLEFRQGKLDFINDIEPSFKDEILTKAGRLRSEWEGKIRLTKHPYLNTQYLGILVDTSSPALRDNPLKLKKIRQAINYGFDRDRMMLYLRNSIGIPAVSGFVPAGLPSFDSVSLRGYRYDPEKARSLLAEAVFPDGRGMPPVKLLTHPVYTDLAAFIANELERTGIPVQVETVRKSLLLEMTANGSATFFLGSWIADYPDPENFLAVFYGKNPAPPNYTRFRNAEFDRLYETALRENNDSIRNKIYQEMDRIIVEEAPVVPLWYDMVIHLEQTHVQGFPANALNILELRRVSFSTSP